jgi:hypothetical protein
VPFKAIRHADREGGRDEPYREIVLDDPVGQRGMDRIHLLGDAQLALAIAEFPTTAHTG